MNYASIEDWFDLLQSEFSNSYEWGLIDPVGSTKTVSERVAVMASKGLEALKEQTECSYTVAESLSHVWWLSQALKKFKYGCTASVDKALEDWSERNKSTGNSAAARLLSPGFKVRHYRYMKRLLVRALPCVDDCDVDGLFGPGAVKEKLDRLQKWSFSDEFSFNVRTMNLVPDRVPSSWTELVCRPVCVPKDFSKHRLITVEPCENSFGQQWVRSLLLRSIHSGPLRDSGMDFLSKKGYAEDRQRQRCLAASKNCADATLDLSNASDCIAWSDVVEVFPAWVVALLERFRTPRYQYKTKTTAEAGSMLMYAGMGNATTFVVESLYFWAVIMSIRESLRADAREVSVFGDDIICGNPTANHPMFEDELRKFGLQINWAKSGRSLVPGFRESCGLVAHSGYALDDLIRINGYRVQRVDGVVELCDLVQRLQGYSSNCEDPNVRAVRRSSPRLSQGGLAKAWIACLISEDLIKNYGVPNLRDHLRQAGVWISNLAYPICQQTRYRYNSETQSAGPEDDKPRNQVLEYSVIVRKPKIKYAAKRNLKLAVALGILRGHLGRPVTVRTKKGVKTLLPVSTERSTYERDWVPVSGE